MLEKQGKRNRNRESEERRKIVFVVEEKNREKYGKGAEVERRSEEERGVRKRK